MTRSYSSAGLLLVGVFALFSNVFGVAVAPRDGSSPSLTYDPKTTTFCSWWIDLNADKTCDSILSDNSITLATFRRWNPSVPASCGSLSAGNSYCVEAYYEPTSSTAGPKTTTAPTTKATTAPPATTTKPSNGITTPSPIQPTIVSNCDAFYMVETGDTCDKISSAHGITSAQLLAWNPSVGSSCGGLWANAYACVSIIGVDPPKTTTTKAGNGVTTPAPIQTGMVSNCHKFHFVETGQTCAIVAAKYSISVADFTKWNPAAKSDCSGLWGNTYACVGIIGGTATTTQKATTTTKNGVSTPTPTQPGMVSNCKKFALVKKDDTCDKIVAAAKITLDNFVKWNTGVGGKTCTSMWANTYVCIGV